MLKVKKLFTRDTKEETVISEWYTPNLADILMCEIHNEMFGVSLRLCYGTYEEFKKLLKEAHNYDTGHESCKAMYCWIERNGETFKYLLIQKMDWTANDYGTIVHELHHFTHLFMKEIGVDYGEGGEEVFAYFQGYYMELVVRAFMGLTKQKNKNTEKKPKVRK